MEKPSSVLLRPWPVVLKASGETSQCGARATRTGGEDRKEESLESRRGASHPGERAAAMARPGGAVGSRCPSTARAGRLGELAGSGTGCEKEGPWDLELRLEESHWASPGLWPAGPVTNACLLLCEVAGIRVFVALVSVSCLMQRSALLPTSRALVPPGDMNRSFRKDFLNISGVLSRPSGA